jgi:hypothetical protein
VAGAKTHFAETGFSLYAQSYYRFSEPVGNVYYVNSAGSGSAQTGPGRTPENAFSSINYALASCVADNNDVVLVCPGHVETITAAAGCALSVAGVSVIGIGEGRNRGRINYTTAVGASLDITAARCVLANLYFTVNGIDNVTAAVNVTAADAIIRACEFELADSTAQAALGILATAAATRLKVLDCDFHGTADAGTTNAIQYAATDEVTIARCRFHGAYATASGAIQNTAAAKGSYIDTCRINNLTATCTKAMIFNAATTGQITDCRMQILSGTAPITGAAMSWVGQNFYAAAVATSPSAI